MLGERDCSIQRRHQKVVEEAPAPGLPESTRRALHAAARKAAAAIGYVGAGTVEFLSTPRRDRFFFLEMNTRLQVEHPVTECVTGVDLVDAAARRRRGPAARPARDRRAYGHAIEVRLYAEDPAARLAAAERDAAPVRRARGVAASSTCSNRPRHPARLGFEAGTRSSTHYDAMLAKVIAWAPTREQAARMLAGALSRARMHGLTTNRDLLVAILRDEAFLAGRGEHRLLRPPRRVAGRDAPRPPDEHLLFAAAVALAERDRLGTAGAGRRPGRRGATSSPSRSARRSPWARRSTRSTGTAVATATAPTDPAVHVLSASPDEVVLEVGRVGARVAATRGTVRLVRFDASSGRRRTRVRASARRPAVRRPRRPGRAGSLLAPMPGTVVGVPVERGRRGHGRPAGPRARGDEDAAHDQAPPTAWSATSVAVGHQVAAGDVLAVVSRDANSRGETSHEQLHRVRGAPGPARGGGQARRRLRPRVLHRAGPQRREDHRAVAAIGKAGYLGVNIPEEYGGGGGGIGDLAAVCEELAAQGCPLLLMVVSPAICGTVISRYGTEEQKQKLAAGHRRRLADDGLRDHRARRRLQLPQHHHHRPTRRRRVAAQRPEDLHLRRRRGRRTCSSSRAPRTRKTGKLKPCLFVVPTDAPGLSFTPIPMEIVCPEKQFQLFLDDVRLPADALVGDEDGGLVQLFAGLNPERIMAASFSTGLGRYALDRATAYVKEREVWGAPIGSHQGIAHPLAQAKIEIELARLMTQKAAALYEAGDDMGAGEAANMAKYAAAEAACDAADRAVQAHGGNGITQEYGVAGLLVAARAGRIAPVSREMILNFVAMHTLGLPKSY